MTFAAGFAGGIVGAVLVEVVRGIVVARVKRRKIAAAMSRLKGGASRG